MDIKLAEITLTYWTKMLFNLKSLNAELVYIFALAIITILTSTALFFFILTRGALIARSVLGNSNHDTSHVYPIYSNIRLIRLIDFQPIISAILLFQYDRLVSVIVNGLQNTDLQGKRLLVTSCAFGNMLPCVVTAAIEAGVQRILIADIVKNELIHAKQKLKANAEKIEFIEENAVAMKQKDSSVAANVIFFLLHELPHHLKGHALQEAGRVLMPGGKLYLAEFHRPNILILRILSWTYFKVFEPLSLALWDTHDPVKQLEALGGFTCERHTIFFSNFQIIIATKNP
ncbi:MAG: class I SAM-dependent methyltransferase [Methylotenera sp.]|nr:class I SAM-dependent methyltransferase [Methylotenera sp.]